MITKHLLLFTLVIKPKCQISSWCLQVDVKAGKKCLWKPAKLKSSMRNSLEKGCFHMLASLNFEFALERKLHFGAQKIPLKQPNPTIQSKGFVTLMSQKVYHTQLNFFEN